MSKGDTNNSADEKKSSRNESTHASSKDELVGCLLNEQLDKRTYLLQVPVNLLPAVVVVDLCAEASAIGAAEAARAQIPANQKSAADAKEAKSTSSNLQAALVQYLLIATMDKRDYLIKLAVSLLPASGLQQLLTEAAAIGVAQPGVEETFSYEPNTDEIAARDENLAEAETPDSPPDAEPPSDYDWEYEDMQDWQDAVTRDWLGEDFDRYKVQPYFQCRSP